MTALKVVGVTILFLALVASAALGGYTFGKKNVLLPADLKTGGPVRSISKTITGQVTQVQSNSVTISKDNQTITITTTNQTKIFSNASATPSSTIKTVTGIKTGQQIIAVQEIQPDGSFLTTVVRIL